MSKMITIATTEQVAEMNAAARKRAVKGSDVRCHNGARSLVHKRRNSYQRFGGKERREVLREE